MNPKIRLLVTDLDNTLYDWVTFFATSFEAMVDVAVKTLEVDRDELLDDLRDVHRKYHNSEQPFALLETRSAAKRFNGLPREQLAERLNDSFHAFNSARKRTLELYPGVAETLGALRARGVRIAAHTEATVPNAQFRLGKLGIAKYVERLYALEHNGELHPSPERFEAIQGVQQVRMIRHEERKPDPRVLLDIVRDMDVSLSETLYVGDSIVRDIGMAKQAGAWAAWAQYGMQYEPKHWDTLVRVTHWSDDDVAKAQADKQRLGATKPDAVLSRFDELLECFEFVA